MKRFKPIDNFDDFIYSILQMHLERISVKSGYQFKAIKGGRERFEVRHLPLIFFAFPGKRRKTRQYDRSEGYCKGFKKNWVI